MAGEDSLGTYIPYEGPTYASEYGGAPVYGGRGRELRNGRYVWGTDAAEQDVNRYREMAGRRESAPYMDTRDANDARGMAWQSRGQQTRSLDLLSQGARGETTDMQLLQGAAQGNTPSRAEILGNRMMDRSLRSQVSAAGNVRGGPGASAAAYRAAAQGAASQRADMAQGIQAERAAEMAQARRDYSGAAGTARGQYFGASTDVRGQDLGLRQQEIDIASKQAQLVAQERAGQRQQEQFYEQMANNTRFGALDAEMRAWGGESNNRFTQRALQNAEAAQDWQKTKDVYSGVTGGTTGMVTYMADSERRDQDTSDRRAKENVRPVIMGSLAGLMTSDRHAKQAARLQGQKEGMAAAGGIVRQYPTDTQQPYSGGIIRTYPDDEPMTTEKLNAAIEHSLNASVSAPDTKSVGAPGRAPEEKGVAGAPKGYAASRKGKEGYMFNVEPEHSTEAPGTADWAKYGEPAAQSGEADWKHGGRTRHTTMSDVKSKNVARGKGEDYGHRTAQASMDKALSEKAEEKRNMPKSFKRDTPQDQAAVKEAYYRSLASQADQIRAGYDQALARGASVARDEGEVESTPGWLTAYMEGQQPQDRSLALSDERAKEQAYNLGRAHQMEKMKTGKAPAGGFEYDASKSDVVDTFINPSKHPELKKTEKPAKPREMKTFQRDADPAKMAEAKKLERASDALSAGAFIPGSLGALAPSAGMQARANKIRDEQNERTRVQTADQIFGRDYPEPTPPPYARPKMHITGKSPEEEMYSDRQAKENVNSTDQAMADAARSMEPSSYTYKSEFTPPSQEPGEVNVGPMANNMAKDPVAGTAIVKDDKTGMLAIDKDKGLKVVMGSLASLQHQIDTLKSKKRAA